MTAAGRAERVSLGARLGLARRGAELLDRKQRILEDEREHMALAAARQREEWERAAVEADRWSARAHALDGSSGIASASPATRAEARLSWSSTMGVRFPAEADCTLPPPGGGGSSALAFAAAAYRAATLAAVRQAAADEAVRLVDAELASTRTRKRAVERRWVPRLSDEVAAIDRRMEDAELEESLRLRWSVEHVSAAERPKPHARTGQEQP